ncbi:hypothetical protein PQX77_020939 [Marasmius sp. AFHP31]|nr:hypothetical protein PQX77_020939 [Marasmius sp. AFHP31]
MTWVRDNCKTKPLSLEFRVVFGDSQVGVTTTVDEKQHEGQITYMVTATGPFTIQGLIGAAPVSNDGSIILYNPINLATQTAVLPNELTQTSSAPFYSATDLNTPGPNDSRAKIVVGSVGGGGFLVVLVIVFLFFRRRRDRRLRDLDKAAAIPDPFSPRTPQSGPSRKQKGRPSERYGAEGSDQQVIERTTGGNQSVGPPEFDDNSPVDQAIYRTMQAQIRLLMQRMERIEAVEEAPPEYVSAYGDTNR